MNFKIAKLMLMFASGISVVAGFTLGTIEIFSSLIGTYYFSGLIGMLLVVLPVALLGLSQSKNSEKYTKTLFLFYLLGILIGLFLVVLGIFHTPCGIETC